MTTYNLYLDFESREYQIEANSPEEAEKILADRIEKEIKALKLLIRVQNDEGREIMEEMKNLYQKYSGLTKDMKGNLEKIEKLNDKMEAKCPNLKPEKDDFIKANQKTIEENFKESCKITEDENKKIGAIVFGPSR